MNDDTQKERPKIVDLPKRKKKLTPAESFLARMEEWKTYFEGQGKDDEYVVMFTNSMRVCIGVPEGVAMIGVYEQEKASYMESITPQEDDTG